MVTLADIDARLTIEAPAIHAPEATTRMVAAWRIDWLLDLRLRLTTGHVPA